jgi:hypothetical protein
MANQNALTGKVLILSDRVLVLETEFEGFKTKVGRIERIIAWLVLSLVTYSAKAGEAENLLKALIP